ncbi:allophanate hydrolase subunit 1 [Agarivorans aestuarii]|uniref:Allophanate hydrolase subunit 1 n=1 Tax=Agarivorans aestuarii TaxID=1563703 RepID=A0ABU7FZ12_9ALTE|nr:allophanate hydrolase subunit 1 [Agarivorans aestuarii]MEE1672411.1 allophanate hydrolase subunit 1 [Agarivorans aestuarii]
MYCIDYVNEDSVLISSHSVSHCQTLPQLASFLKDQLDNISDIIVASDTLLCIGNNQTQFESIGAAVQQFELQLGRPSSKQTFDIPVCYAQQLAPDLSGVAQQLQLSVNQVIELHKQSVYKVKMIGFMPGFTYLSGLSPQLSLPRKSTPASKVPAGSLAIAEDMSAVYPSDSPGGWHIIGQSPIKLFDKHVEPMCPLEVGDQVRFVELTYKEFLNYGGSSV